jgi:NAD(P)-dependent dehydrogenase (short-subunit alcohol dehydrogenase family)
MDLGISGRTAVVTGATRGIGAAVARLLREDGAHVVSVARSEGIDVTAPDAAERIAERAGGVVDILVNNAGTSRIPPLEETADADWYAAFELNVMAPMRLMRRFAPAMAERGWGRIVNVTSSAGKRPSLTWPAYSVAKAAQHSLSRVFADRWAEPACSSTPWRPARRRRPCGWSRAGWPTRSRSGRASRARRRWLARRRSRRSGGSARRRRSPP